MNQDTMTTYKCEKCNYHITRLTNMEPEKRMACVKCEGWMYPVEPDDNYSLLGRIIDRVIGLFRR